ncbi:uncharacterized protein KD926_001305 [Aspergillus affinis]|uniref:uncharacterized protein n=1 Tax=Aspergillus affinis TaxID=1070780 RepID=UPI0022FE9499|nr:uncharacterized protein KD926_001305 [Aspergillus affinis]KAI9036783.1 hypothetical protein KD926_001305 [Aspergillus affinis]
MAVRTAVKTQDEIRTEFKTLVLETLGYPPDKYHIYVLDDNGSLDVKDLVCGFQKRLQNLHYANRGLALRTHSKAGNLNFGLCQSLLHSNSEFVAVLDVDMIPEKDWLGVLLPHLLQDDQAGLAYPPQIFHDIPQKDTLTLVSGNQLVTKILLPLQDSTDNSICTGPGLVARRSALADIDNFPTESMQEDALTSIKLCSPNWKVLYIPEALQWGILPHTYQGAIQNEQRALISMPFMVRYLLGPHVRHYKGRVALAFGFIVKLVEPIFITAAICLLARLYCRLSH